MANFSPGWNFILGKVVEFCCDYIVNFREGYNLNASTQSFSACYPRMKIPPFCSESRDEIIFWLTWLKFSMWWPLRLRALFWGHSNYMKNWSFCLTHLLIVTIVRLRYDSLIFCRFSSHAHNSHWRTPCSVPRHDRYNSKLPLCGSLR